MKMKNWLSPIMLAGCLILSPSAEAAKQVILSDQEEIPKVIVDATAEASAKPDIATVELVVTATEGKLQRAFSKTTTVSNKILAALKERGVQPEDIQSRAYQIIPIYEGKRKPSRYTVTHELSAKIRNFETVGPLLDDFVDDEVTQVQNVSFQVENLYPLEQSAREKAAKLAREKAETLSKNAGAKLGRVLKITEGASWVQPMVRTQDMAKGMYLAQVESAPPSLSPGEIKVSVTCHTEFALES